MDISIEYQKRMPSFYMNSGHSHKQCEVFYLKSGICTYYTENGIFNLEAGDVMIIPSEAKHRTKYKGAVDCERYVLLFPLSDLESAITAGHDTLLSHFNTATRVSFTRKTNHEISEIFQRLYKESSVNDSLKSEFSALYLYELLLLLERYGIFTQDGIGITSVLSSEIEDACYFIVKNHSDSITLKDVSSYVNLSPCYFSKKFKKETGKSFICYLKLVRLQKACRLLLTTNNTITEIAVQCGFSSANYFKDVFDKEFNVSPRTFRKKSVKEKEKRF